MLRMCTSTIIYTGVEDVQMNTEQLSTQVSRMYSSTVIYTGVEDIQ